jgi:hypothetical protein
MLWSCLLLVVTAAPASACLTGGVVVGLAIQVPSPEVVLAMASLSPPPMVFAEPVIVAEPRVIAAPVERPTVIEGPAHLALKYMPGLNSTVVLDSALAVGHPRFAHSVGLEFRFNRFFALRSDLEMRSASHSWDAVGLKFSIPIPVWSPYLSASVSASEAANAPGQYQLGAVASAGFDLKFGRHFFIEAEARYRVAPGECCRTQPQLTALLGAGVAFF